MASYSKAIVDNIKQEEETEDEKVLDQFTVVDFVGDIKHEPERHFVFIMPDDPEIEEVKEVKVVLRKFDRNWKTNSAMMFETFFVCGKCDFAAKKSGVMSKHKKCCKIHQKCEKCFSESKSEIVSECGMCDSKFNCSNCKTKHFDQVHRKGSNWHCTKCDYKSFSKEYLRHHFQSHVKKFSCETCKQNFSLKRTLKLHQQHHRHGVFANEPETKFECKSCVQSFATKSKLYEHETRVHSEMKFHCDICGRAFKVKSKLKRHMQTHLKVPCPICQHMLSEDRLEEHKVMKHSAKEKFKCNSCEKVYFIQGKLNEHKKRNHEIVEVQCDLCSKICKNKISLREHMMVHLKVPCPICTKLMIKTKLNRHIKHSHSSGQQFLACNIALCKQKFANIKEQKEHSQIHIGVGIYKCPKCDHKAKDWRTLKSHMKHNSHEA